MACLEMAAGREAASAAAIEVISDGYFFWVQVKKGPGTYKRTMDTGNQQSWRRFRRFTMRTRLRHITSRQCGTFCFCFFVFT